MALLLHEIAHVLHSMTLILPKETHGDDGVNKVKEIMITKGLKNVRSKSNAHIQDTVYLLLKNGSKMYLYYQRCKRKALSDEITTFAGQI